MNAKLMALVGIAIIGLSIPSAYADGIPLWVKHNAAWWSQGQLGDDEFVKGIQYMVENGIMKIPPSKKTMSTSESIPSWVKHNAGWWADGTLAETDFVSGMQYLIASGAIRISPLSTSVEDTTTHTSLCDSAKNAADKEICLDDLQKATKIQEQIKNATPYVVGPVTYYLVGTDGISTGDGGIIITAHTIIENTGSSTSNVDLFCTGPYACNYHLTDGQNQYPPQIFSLTSGHLEIIYHKPVAIDWGFYSNNNLAKFTYDPNKQYSLKVDEPFGKGLIPLEINLQ